MHTTEEIITGLGLKFQKFPERQKSETKPKQPAIQGSGKIRKPHRHTHLKSKVLPYLRKAGLKGETLFQATLEFVRENYELTPDFPEQEVRDLCEWFSRQEQPRNTNGFDVPKIVSSRDLIESQESDREYQPSPEIKPAQEDPHLSDMGNAQRMARIYSGKIQRCRALGWLIYDGKRWTVDALSQVQAYAKETVRQMYQEAADSPEENCRKALVSHAMKCEAASKIEAMIKLLPSEPGISVSHDLFDLDQMLLNVTNGTIDLQTGALRPHSADDLITKMSPVEFDVNAKCNRWLQFVDEIMGGDEALAAFLKRMSGYIATGRTGEQVWFFFWGKGQNGKGTFLDAFAYVLGDYALNTPPETFLETSGNTIRNDLARLRGARLITASEPPHKKFDSSILKAFTGEDQITARFLHKELFEFKPEGKLVFSANHRPPVRDSSYGFWRRVILIPFTQVFAGDKTDPHLRESLRAEAPGILNWIIDGALEWQAQGLQPPEKVRQTVREYQIETDVLDDFLKNHCFMIPGESVPKTQLYDVYLQYCRTSSIRMPLSRQRFNEDLLGRQGISETQLGPSRTRSWLGIGLGTAHAESHSYQAERWGTADEREYETSGN